MKKFTYLAILLFSVSSFCGLHAQEAIEDDDSNEDEIESSESEKEVYCRNMINFNTEINTEINKENPDEKYYHSRRYS